MKHSFACLALMGALAALPLAASATMSDAEATTAVQDMLIERKSSQEVIGFLIGDGRSLKDATVLAVQAVTGHAKVNLARVGICLARDNEEAESIARACETVCTAVSDKIIESLVQNYVTGGCEEPEYEFPSGPTGGGSVSPSI